MIFSNTHTRPMLIALEVTLQSVYCMAAWFIGVYFQNYTKINLMCIFKLILVKKKKKKPLCSLSLNNFCVFKYSNVNVFLNG